MKDIPELCLKIISIPEVFQRERNVSFYSLLKQSGYYEMHDQITVEAIRQALFEQPHYVKDWIQYSEDQRCTGWFFLKKRSHYEVGFLPSEGDEMPVTKYSDRFEACATFIKHKIEAVRVSIK